MTRKTSTRIREVQFRNGVLAEGSRIVPEEVPIAFSYGGTTHAVMMATPADLEDFALGFSLSEGIISAAADIVSVEMMEAGDGIDLQIVLADGTAEALTARRRHMAGPVGCGLCGIESIEQATRSVAPVDAGDFSLTPAQIAEAVWLLGDGQSLNRETRAVHGAGFFIPGQGLVCLREDVGRHNALDKLAGAVMRSGLAGGHGAVVVTSRLSVEMVQKTAALRSAVLIAVSAPTALAVRTAEAAGITLVGIARGDEFEIFTRPERTIAGVTAHVA
ncbi:MULTISPECIES: formate dehydrogenase accessory sulfurtransferase FdhD [Alphaproteobacteria]|uniref:Sulfur carrier protein FdhD n=2 Tax=Alphaproteobacteria TaxID=28211 RepID=A0A512HK36_9HYPH|nr:formate dehydrogenase accessory sulfurtransferase FdhD [Sphingomonas psychrolutea]GEO85770.1 sulfurtransferase FdhD [Ciceribacter naphthalenivorans]GLR21870.1 sulfurtransferase FdhD [Ciceribacter naphthalenivorans]GLT04726.1 sulfurtransferase FdhD [Sphingomonas psychrolutea]